MTQVSIPMPGKMEVRNVQKQGRKPFYFVRSTFWKEYFSIRHLWKLQTANEVMCFLSRSITEINMKHNQLKVESMNKNAGHQDSTSTWCNF
jgi:hypothetical protein